MILNLSQVALSAVAAVASADVVNPALTLPYAYGVHAFGGGRLPHHDHYCPQSFSGGGLYSK